MKGVCHHCRQPIAPDAYGNHRKKKYCNQVCMGLSYRVTAEDFWAKVNKTDGCWLWTGHVQNYGYGEFGRQPRRWLAHRFSYTLAYGEIPKGQLVLHTCDTPRCVRPDHLRLGTDADNKADAVAKLRHTWGEKNSHAILKAEDVLRVRADYRCKRSGRRVVWSNAREIAQQHGVTAQAILHIVARRTWRHL